MKRPATALRSATAIVLIHLTCGWLSGTASATPAPLPEAVGPRHDSYLLELPGPVNFTLYEDFDGDNLIDILAVYGDDNPRHPARSLAVFFQRSVGFPDQPDLLYTIPDDITLIDTGEVCPASPGQELLLLSDHDLRWVGLPRSPETADIPENLIGQGTPLIEVKSAFAHAQWNHLNHRNFARTTDRNTSSTLFIPVTDGYRIFHPTNAYADSQNFVVEHHHQVRTSGYAVSVSEFKLADINGDGRQDLAFTYLDQLRVHYRQETGFSDTPDLDLHMDILAQMDFEIPAGLTELVGFSIRDLDNDGWADLFVWKTVVKEKAVVNDKKQYQVYHNKQGHFDLLPDQAFVLKSLDEPHLHDINGDQKLDLMTGHVQLDLGNIIKALLTKRIKIDLAFFQYEDGGYPYQPQEERDFKVRISLEDMDENFVPAVEIEGDFDGDGRCDFLLQSDDKVLEIFPGCADPDRIFTKKAQFELETYGSESATVKDLNGDGVSDIVFDRFQDREPFNPAWINVVLSRSRDRS